MTLLSPLWLQKTGADPDISYTATNFRLGALSAVFPIEGVIDPVGSGGLLVTQRAAGANFSVDVAPGTAVITGTDIAFQGAYTCVSTAVTNVVVPAAPVSGTRVHRVIARVKDKLNNGAWSTYEWTIELLADTGGGTPAEPASAITLATVSVTVGQASVTNANIVSLRPWARSALSTTGLLSITAAWACTDANRPLSYRLTADGFVHLYGWVSRALTPFSAGAGSSFDFATIPVGARPNSNRDGVIATNVSPSPAARCLVSSAGLVSFILHTTSTINISDWFSLDGVSYKL